MKGLRLTRCLSFIVILFLLSSCTTPTPSTTGTTQQAPSSGTSQQVPASGTPSQVLTSGPLTLAITSPEEDAVTSAAQVAITGSVSENVTMSVNDDIYLLKAGNFSQPVTLQEGVNVLQIVVSDESGNEIDLVLTVTYTP